MPTAAALATARLGWPSYVFDHMVVLLVVAIAAWGGAVPAVVTAVTSVIANNVLLHSPFGRPIIIGAHDGLDLALFVTVALVMSAFASRAHRAREAADRAAEAEGLAHQERDALVEAVIHDLATPLSVLHGTVHVAARQRERTESDWGDLLTRLDAASTRALALVRTLRDVRALNGHQLQLDLRPVDIRSVVTRVVAMLDGWSPAHRIEISAPETPLIVPGDDDRLASVVENLLTNAVKYSPQGGVVEVTVRASGDRAFLDVRDHGIGIGTDELSRAFERGYRTAAAAAHASGLGLGLSIAARIVRRHGGTIEMTRADGGGTVVSVGLPRALHASPISPVAVAERSLPSVVEGPVKSDNWAGGHQSTDAPDALRRG